MKQLTCNECQSPLVYICNWGVGYKRYRCVDCETEFIVDNKSHKIIETIHPFVVPNPEDHNPDCQCAVCVYGQDEWIRNFHASEY